MPYTKQATLQHKLKSLKRYTFKSVIFLCFIAAISACNPNNDVRGNKKLANQLRTPSNVARVVLKHEAILRIVQADVESLSIDAEENLLPYLETNLENGTLSLDYPEDRVLKPTLPIRYTLSVNNLSGASMASRSGEGQVIIESIISDEFNIAILGPGIIRANDLKVSSLNASAVNFGTLELAGQSESFNYYGDGSSLLNAQQLAIGEAVVVLKNKSEATLCALSSITIDKDEKSLLHYFGEAVPHILLSADNINDEAACP